MSDSLSAVWNQVKKLLSDGLSLIPVRDKDSGDRKAKMPYQGWKKYQSQQITEAELYSQMEFYNTTAVAIICGAISGSLEVIDVDVKHKPGIDAALFGIIRELYPNLYARLRIHKTPSGGYHILYKTLGGNVPGNTKLATRPATDAELISHPKVRNYSFIETRGEGGYILAPPSLRYSIHTGNDIPIISHEERCAIIQIARSLTEEVAVTKPVATSTRSDYYEENPFEHYNATCDAVALAEQCGMTFVRRSNGHLWFTRPGGKAKDVHITFREDRRLFYVFSTNTGLDSDKWYQPCTILAHFEYNGDKKRLYAALVAQGYGKIRPKHEAEMLRRNHKLPTNASPEAQQQHAQQQATAAVQYPYGIFWTFDPDTEECRISREGIYAVSAGLGFCLYDDNLHQVRDGFLHWQQKREYFDALKAYITEEDGDLYEQICNAYEAFVQRSGDFTITRLRIITQAEVMHDSRNHANKFYTNGYTTITHDSHTFNQYPAPLLIPAERVQPREYTHTPPGGLYADFLTKALGTQPTTEVLAAIGYLTHEYKDETTAYIIVLTEQCADPKNGGGSGKNVFCDLLKYATTYTSKPGSQTKFDEKFFQSWNGQRVFGISDLPKDFDFAALKEPSSGSFILKKLFKDETIIPVSAAPKFICQTNFSYSISDGGLKRRIKPIEFSEFFTRAGGVDVHYGGKHFPNDWLPQDWAGYDAVIAQAIQVWLQQGRKLPTAALSETGWEKQFEHTYGAVAGRLVQEMWPVWVERGFVSNDDFRTGVEAWYVTNAISHTYRPSMIKLNAAIEAWAEHHGGEYDKDFQKKIDGINTKGRQFYADKLLF